MLVDDSSILIAYGFMFKRANEHVDAGYPVAFDDGL